ncbi:MAG: YicC family protein [Bacteroidetes bacterium]|nr:YicC family protein [Bacteroidota bacterium]
MLKSMTGFGRAAISVGDKLFAIDLKSLNGKQFELQLKMPALLKPFEFEIRKCLAENLGRGTIDCQVSLKDAGPIIPVSINTQMARSYYQSLAQLAVELGLDTSQLLPSLLKLPDVITSGSEGLAETEWELFKQGLQEAITAINKHRTEEGKALETDLLERIAQIEKRQIAIAELDPVRREKLRASMNKSMKEHLKEEAIDRNRMEQELIYYIEKMDITEELVRLSNHCSYFREQVESAEEGKGKKLSFILQEIGREINTTGSKAYDAGIQRLVVEMKDELEKAKEQVLNIL